jgi:carboxypeptidase C (cathepsin A)
MKLYRRTLLGYIISLGLVSAVPAFTELRLTSPHFTVEAQSPAAAQVAAGDERSVEGQITNRENQLVTTRHQVVVAGQVLKYTARAGRLPILDNETGQVHAWMFFTSYTLDSPRRPEMRPGCCSRASQPQPPSQHRPLRPLMFLWNGGPGSSSSLVHLLGFGPRRLQPDGTAVANQGTWLDIADLVFVDPIGTGYSRPTKPEYGNEFYQTRGDAESVAEFIRIYRNRFEAWQAPLFLAGESYGVTRAAAVVDILERRQITVAGVILIGLEMPLGQLSTEVRTALLLPTFTAAAFANHKLAPELQKDLHETLRQADEWARTEYATALAGRDNLTDAKRAEILSRLSKFTGISLNQLNPKTLSIGMEEFSERLLADDNRVVGRYDSRLTGPRDPKQEQYDPTQDPSLKDIINDLGVLRYFRNELRYASDLQYQGPFGGGYPPAASFRGDWMSVKWSRNPAATESRRIAASSEQPLRRAMRTNPKLRVLSACGYYDLVCAYRANQYVASQLESDLARNIVARGYWGGHALYTDLRAQLDLKRDVVRFVQEAFVSARKEAVSRQPRK